MLRRSQGLRSLLAVPAVLLVACLPTTDRDTYAPGDSGSVTIENALRSLTFFLPGCAHFEVQKRIGRRWVTQAPEIECVWEGFAQAVVPGASVTDAFVARDPGHWRLRYSIGLGCSDDEPFSQCATSFPLASNAFEVVEANDCIVTGCSGQVCAGEPVATTCEWLPHYACFRDARCGHFGPADECAWEPTAELAACLEANGAPLTPR